MRVVRFGSCLALGVAVALGGCGADRGGPARSQAHAELAREVDQQLDATLTQMIASAEIGPGGEVFFARPLGDDGFLKANSGRYWQISGAGHDPFASRSLWDRRLALSGRKALGEALFYDSGQFHDEPLRVAERTVRLPGSAVEWQFVVARGRAARPG